MSNQLDIEFSNTQNFNSFYLYISSKLKPLLNESSLQDWINSIGNKFYEQKNNGKDNYIRIENYFELANVKACVMNKNLSVNARLVNNDSYFIIELKDTPFLRNISNNRFVTAHELAHTLFYDTRRTPFINYQFFPTGSKEIEFLCNRISRSLLLPTLILKDKLSRIPSPYNTAFTLDTINTLCSSFKVNHSVLLNRIIVDTGMWNCLLLRFKLFENDENEWRLKETYLPDYYWRTVKAYIPTQNITKDKSNPSRYPKVRGKLKKEFNSVHTELKAKKRLSRIYLGEDIIDRPLREFLKYYFGVNSQITFHYSLGIDSYTKSEFLNLCIPLPLPKE